MENKEKNENAQWHQMYNLTGKGNLKQAAQICLDMDWCAIDLIRMNEDAKDCYIPYYDSDQDKYDILPYFKNLNHLIIIIEKKNELILKNK